MLKGTLYIGVSQIIFIITGFFLHVYLGRTLGPEQYGVFGVINAFIMINELILMKGIYDTISKFVAEKEEAAQSIISTMFKSMSIVGIAVGTLYFFLAGQIASMLNDPALTEYLKLFAFIIPFSAVSTVFLGALNGLRQFRKQSFILILFYIARVTAVVIFMLSGFSVKGVIYGLLIADILKLAMAGGLYRPVGRNKYQEGRKMFWFAVQLMVISLLSALIMHIDLLAVKTIIGDNFETGLYTSAMTIAKIPAFMIIPITITLLPVISKTISEGDIELTEKRINQALKLLLMIVLPTSLIVIATSDQCISLLFGSRYLQASSSLKILLIGGIFISAKVLMYSVIIASGCPKYIIYIGLFSLLSEIILLVTFINKFGLQGAAFASALTHFFGFLISYGYVARRFMKQMLPLFAMRIVSAAIAVYIMAALYSPSGIALFFYYALLIGIFFFILVCIKEINLTEVKLLLSGKFGMIKSGDLSSRSPK